MKGISIVWGTPVVGRERLALEEFTSYVQWATKLKTEGKLARFELYAPQFGRYETYAGFSIIEGSKAQIDAILDSDDFRARVQRVFTVAHGVRVDAIDTADDVLMRMKNYGAAIQQLKL